MLSKNPIFIIGFPRSGTTLLQSLFLTQSNVYSLPETHYFCYIMNYFEYDINGKIKPSCLGLVFKLIKEKIDLEINNDDKVFLIEKSNKKNLFIKFFFEFIVKKMIKDEVGDKLMSDIIWVEKTPGHIKNINFIHSLYPEARFVFIIRNPLNAIASYRKNFKKNIRRTHLAHKWKGSVDLFLNFQKKYPNNSILLRYEDLISKNDKSHFKLVCDFLNIKINIKKIRNLKAQAKKIVLKREKHKFKNLNSALDSNIFNYHWNFKDKLLTQYLLNDYLKMFGYTDGLGVYQILYNLAIRSTNILRKISFIKFLILPAKKVLRKFNFWPYDEN